MIDIIDRFSSFCMSQLQRNENLLQALAELAKTRLSVHPCWLKVESIHMELLKTKELVFERNTKLV